MFKGKISIGISILALTLILDRFFIIPDFIAGLGFGLSLVIIIVAVIKDRDI